MVQRYEEKCSDGFSIFVDKDQAEGIGKGRLLHGGDSSKDLSANAASFRDEDLRGDDYFKYAKRQSWNMMWIVFSDNLGV